MKHILLKDGFEVVGVIRDISGRNVDDISEAIKELISYHFDVDVNIIDNNYDYQIVSWKTKGNFPIQDTIEFEDEFGSLYVLDVERTFIY